METVIVLGKTLDREKLCTLFDVLLNFVRVKQIS